MVNHQTLYWQQSVHKSFRSMITYLLHATSSADQYSSIQRKLLHHQRLEHRLKLMHEKTFHISFQQSLGCFSLPILSITSNSDVTGLTLEWLCLHHRYYILRDYSI